MKEEEWVVAREEGGLSLLQFCKKRLSEEISGKKIKAAIERNAALVNRQIERFASRKLKAGDRVRFSYEDSAEEFSISSSGVLYEDPHCLVYNKPSGILSEEGGLLTALSELYGRLYLVHRLDKGTSGAIVFARTPAAKDALLEAFRHRKVEKEYWAVVQGRMESDQGKIDFPLVKTGSFAGQTLWGRGEEGREALTLWRVKKRGEEHTLLSCRPRTGRTHQLRVHLAGIGYPIAGDGQYGRRQQASYVPRRPLLHSRSLSFLLEKKQVSVKAPVPDDFQRAIDHLFA